MIRRFIVAVEGPNLSDLEEAELVHPPGDGEPIETRYGTCIVTGTEMFTDNDTYAGKIMCKMT